MSIVEITLFGIPLILISAAMLGFFTAYGVGANDVANAMGTSVGSKVLTVHQAVLIAAIFEFLGAFLAGGGVTQTIRKGVIDPALFSDNLETLIYGMIASLFAAGLWLLIASLRGWPVSTTHTIVGAIVGFGVYSLGADKIDWGVVGNISISWITSPLSAALLAGFLYWICRDFILAKNSKYEVLIISVNIFLTGFAIALITTTKGLKNIFKQQGFDITFFQSTQISVIVALAFSYVFYQFLKSKFQGGDIKSEAQFAYLMIFTSCAVAFAHGSNDVANAIGPLAAVYQASYQLIGQEFSQETPIWILLLGAVGIVIGLATLGYRVMQTIGEKIVKLTPSKGFSAQLAAALTVIVASQLNMPVSTTHTLVGAVIGIGIIEGAGAVNVKSVQTIFLSWIVTLPAGALFAILFLEVFQNIFTY